MFTHKHIDRPVRGSASPGLAAGLLAALALLSAACSDSTSNATGPEFVPSPSYSSLAQASDFAVLANAAVTCTDGSIVGDVGTFLPPGDGGAFTGTNCPVDGSIHLGDGLAKQAYEDFLAEYDALAPAPGFCTVTNTLTGTLAGASVSPGTYCVDAVAKTGELTLTGNGEWTFLVLGALTGSSFSVSMPDGGDPCDVTWWVDDASTMTDSNLIGSILAGAAITLTGGTFHGNAWAGADGVGDLTITGTEVTGCEDGTPGRPSKEKCNQGVGNGPEACDPGNSNHKLGSNDEEGGTPGNPGRKGGR